MKVGTFTYDDNAASDKGNVYEGALVTVTFDENNQLWKDSGLSFDHWDIQSKAKLVDENGEEIVNPGKTFTFVMPKEGVTIEAMPKDATIEEGRRAQCPGHCRDHWYCRCGRCSAGLSGLFSGR